MDCMRQCKGWQQGCDQKMVVFGRGDLDCLGKLSLLFRQKMTRYLEKNPKGSDHSFESVKLASLGSAKRPHQLSISGHENSHSITSPYRISSKMQASERSRSGIWAPAREQPNGTKTQVEKIASSRKRNKNCGATVINSPPKWTCCSPSMRSSSTRNDVSSYMLWPGLFLYAPIAWSLLLICSYSLQ